MIDFLLGEKVGIVTGSIVVILLWAFIENDPDVFLGGMISVAVLILLLFTIPLFRKIIGIK